MNLNLQKMLTKAIDKKMQPLRCYLNLLTSHIEIKFVFNSHPFFPYQTKMFVFREWKKSLGGFSTTSTIVNQGLSLFKPIGIRG